MISNLRALFLARLLREKLLLVAFALIGALLWLSNLAGRAGAFLTEERHTTVSLAEQSRWLANSKAVEKAAKQAAQAFKPEKTLDGTGLLTEVDRIAKSSELEHHQISQPEEAHVGQSKVNTILFTVNKVDYRALSNFCAALQQRAPYIALEGFSVVPDKSNPLWLNASMRISSVEIDRGAPSASSH